MLAWDFCKLTISNRYIKIDNTNLDKDKNVYKRGKMLTFCGKNDQRCNNPKLTNLAPKRVICCHNSAFFLLNKKYKIHKFWAIKAT